MFDTIEDVLEKHPISVDDAGRSAASARKVLKQALESYPDAGRNANRKRQAAKQK